MGMETGGKWSVEERKLHINIVELLAVKNAILAFTKEKTINAIQIQTDNTTALSYLLKMGDTCRFKQGHLEISDIEADHNYCRISPRYSEHKSRLAVPSQQGLLGMEVISNSIPTYLLENGDASDRSVCFQIIQPNSKIFCLETRPTQFSYECNATRMEPGNSICISPVFFILESTLQNSKGESQYRNIDNYSMANSTLVSKSSCNVIFSTFSTPNVSRSSEGLERGRPPLDNKQIFSTSGLEGYRETLVKSGISERAAHLIVNSKRQGSSVNYNSSWKKWSSWCYRKQIDPFRCPINYVLDFLACLYEEGYAYRSINCYRSAISSFHEKIEGLPVGQHPEVCTLLTAGFNLRPPHPEVCTLLTEGFNLRPPQPRYSSTWDVQIVLEFIKNNWTDNKSLPNKNLTLKLTMLLAPTSASRASNIHHLDIRFMSLSEEKVVFNFPKLLKTWKKGRAPPKLETFAFEKDTDLCVIQRCIWIHHKNGEMKKKTQLLLGINNPYKPVSVSTVSRWVKDIMLLSGIDVSLFKGHSTRSASLSRASLSGASIQEILGESR